MASLILMLEYLHGEGSRSPLRQADIGGSMQACSAIADFSVSPLPY